MFIGGLNWDTTDGSFSLFHVTYLTAESVLLDGLKKYFEQFGRVEACTIMRDGTGRSRCFAFLTFEEPASVNAVMVREHYLDGKIASVLIVTSRMCTNNQLIDRLILSAQSQDKNINARKNFLSED